MGDLIAKCREHGGKPLYELIEGERAYVIDWCFISDGTSKIVVLQNEPCFPRKMGTADTMIERRGDVILVRDTPLIASERGLYQVEAGAPVFEARAEPLTLEEKVDILWKARHG